MTLEASEARLRKEAELREEASRIALLVTQRRFEEADKLLAGIPLISLPSKSPPNCAR